MTLYKVIKLDHRAKAFGVARLGHDQYGNCRSPWGYQKHTFEVLQSILSEHEVPSSSTPVDRKGKGKEKADLDLSSSPEEKKKKKGTAKTVKGKKKADTSSRKGRKKEEGSGKASTSKTQ